MNFSDRCNKIKPLPTVAMKHKYEELRLKGEKIFDLSIGDTNFIPPKLFEREIAKAIRKGKTHYTASMGIDELRQNIAERHNVSPEEVLVSAGGKEGIFSLFLATVNPKDEVVFPLPSWPAYEAYINLCNAISKTIDTFIDEDFEPAINSIQEKISEKTKMIVLNSPNNPTGAVYSKKFIKAVAEIADDNDVLLLSDEIYSNYDYSGEFISAKNMGENVVILDGFSKTFGVTGLRLCYLVADKAIIDSVNKIHTYNVGNATSIIQYASVKFFEEKEYMDKNREEMRQRNELAYKTLKNTSGLKINKPKGAFYLFPGYDSKESSLKICEKVFLDKKVGLVPGSAFGIEKHFRIAFSQPRNILQEGLERIKNFFEEKQ